MLTTSFCWCLLRTSQHEKLSNPMLWIQTYYICEKSNILSYRLMIYFQIIEGSFKSVWFEMCFETSPDTNITFMACFDNTIHIFWGIDLFSYSLLQDLLPMATHAGNVRFTTPSRFLILNTTLLATDLRAKNNRGGHSETESHQETWNWVTWKFLVSTPLKINMEPKYAGWKMSFLFKQVIFRFHVNFPGVCSTDVYHDLWLLQPKGGVWTMRPWPMSKLGRKLRKLEKEWL